MALANYTDLKTAVASWMHRDDLTAHLGDFVTLAEARIARDLRIRKQVTNTTLSTVAGVQYVTLPADFLEIENIGLSNTTPPRNLHVITPELMDEMWPAAYNSGVPTNFTIVGDKLILGPTPDGVYTVTLDYYQRLDLASTTTNWLMTNHPNVYLYACLIEACGLAQQDDTVWVTKYERDIDNLQTTDDAALRSGSVMRVRKA